MLLGKPRIAWRISVEVTWQREKLCEGSVKRKGVICHTLLGALQSNFLYPLSDKTAEFFFLITCFRQDDKTRLPIKNTRIVRIFLLIQWSWNLPCDNAQHIDFIKTFRIHRVFFQTAQTKYIPKKPCTSIEGNISDLFPRVPNAELKNFLIFIVIILIYLRLLFSLNGVFS